MTPSEAVAHALIVTSQCGLTDLIGPLKMAQGEMFALALRVETLEMHLRNVLEVCAAENIHGRGALDDAADALG